MRKLINAMPKLLGIVAAAAVAAGAIPIVQAQTGKLRIVTEGGFPPWNMTDPSGKVVGFDIDLANAICAELKVECSIESQTFDAMIPALNDGKYDMIVDFLGITDARKKVIDFTVPYAGFCYSFASVSPAAKKRLPAEDRLLILTEENLKNMMDAYKTAFEGATIGTLSSGTSTRFTTKNLADVKTSTYKTPAARDLDLKAGRVDVILTSKDVVLTMKKEQKIEGLELVGPCLRGDVLGSGAVGIGVKKGNTELKAKLDPVIEKLVKNGTVKTLSEKRFGMDMSPIGLN